MDEGVPQFYLDFFPENYPVLGSLGDFGMEVGN